MKSLIIVFALALVALFAGLFKKRSLIQPLLILGLLGALGVTIADWFATTFAFTGMMAFDHFSLLFSGTAIVATILVVLLAGNAFKQANETLGDYYGLMLFSLTGALCLFSYEHLVMLFLGIEIMSIPLYVLVGSRKDNLLSNEAAFKYFLMGAFSTGVMLMGITLVYGATGHFDLTGIEQAVTKGGLPLFFNVGVLLILCALVFKVGGVPFHFWVPDVYHGSPTIITTFMATVVKIGAFGAFARLFLGALSTETTIWPDVLAIITITIGNFGALFQKQFKRMMVWSSVSHAGYLMMGLLTTNPNNGNIALLWYLLAYATATICAFAIYMYWKSETKQTGFKVFAHIGRTHPLAGWALAISMLSLAGIPPLAGFFGKYFVFTQALSAYPVLVVVAVINSAISLAYYFKPIIAAWFNNYSVDETNQTAAGFTLDTNYKLVLIIGILVLVALSGLPGFALGLLR